MYRTRVPAKSHDTVMQCSFGVVEPCLIKQVSCERCPLELEESPTGGLACYLQAAEQPPCSVTTTRPRAEPDRARGAER
jgi:hypothetical protein